MRLHVFRVLLIVALICNLSAQTPDAAEDIRPPKEVVIVPKTFVESLQEDKPTVLFWSSVGVGAVLLIAGIIVFRKIYLKRQLNSSARAALMALRELQSDQEGIGAEAFAYLASKILRQYIADRFGIVAPKQTTEEFLQALTKDVSSPLNSECDHLRAFLKSCDLAKFAGVNLDFNQRIELLDTARNFIRSTSRATTP